MSPAADPDRRAPLLRTPAGLLAVALAGIVLLTGALLLGPGYDPATSAAAANGPADGPDWYVARRQSFDLTVIESGQLEAARKVEIKSRVDGRPAIIELVDEGVSVKAGDLLVHLDNAQIIRDLEEAELRLETARAEKIKAEQDLSIQISESESTRRAAEVELQLAELEFAEWDQGEVPTQKRTLKLALDKAEREVERTRRNFETDKELYGQKFISRDELDDSEIAMIEAVDELATAKLDIEVYEKYTFFKEQQEKQSAVDQARGELERTLAQNDSKLAQMRADTESKTRGLTIEEQRVADLKVQLAACTINAPQDGMVVYASSVGRYRNDPIAEGREVRNNETILLLPDTSQLVAVLSVPEAMAPRVRPGHPASISIDAVPDEVFEGSVESISVLAEDGGWWNNNVKNFTVRVLLPPNAGEGSLKPTMTATGTIFIGRVDDAMTVPIQAVFADGPQRYVFVAAGGGKVSRQDVKIGQASETLVEITDGLAEETRVLLRAPQPGEEAAR